MRVKYLSFPLWVSLFLMVLPFVAFAQEEGAGEENLPLTEEQRRLLRSQETGWPDIRNHKKEEGGNEYMDYQEFSKEDEDAMINMLLTESKGRSKAQVMAQKEFIALLRKYELTPKEKMAVTNHEMNLPLKFRDKILYRRAMRKRRKLIEKTDELLEDLLMKTQPNKEFRDRIRNTRRRSERFRKHGTTAPWYIRWKRKIKGWFEPDPF